MRHIFLLLIFIGSITFLPAQNSSSLFEGTWKGSLLRKDAVPIVFLFTLEKVQKWYEIKIKNGEELLQVPDIAITGDSMFFDMPFFESSFRIGIQNDGTMKGVMTKGTAASPVIWPFYAIPNSKERFEVLRSPVFNISGRWSATFINSAGKQRPAIAEFSQQGAHVTGSFLTPSGDYRYLEGIVSGDSLYLSAFDGSHVYLFTALIASKDEITNGVFYSGSSGKDLWEARFDPSALLPDMGNTPLIKDQDMAIDFRFPDLDSNLVALSDMRFRGKVVVLQLMGSWCPNCMDETRFLSEYHKANRNRGVEVIALAYEYSTDFQRSQKSIVRFKDRFAVEYPMLITGVRVNDSLRTEKTLPNITPVKVFPTTLYIGKDRRIRKIETGFNGPGTGIHYEAYKKEFEETVDALLRE